MYGIIKISIKFIQITAEISHKEAETILFVVSFRRIYAEYP